MKAQEEEKKIDFFFLIVKFRVLRRQKQKLFVEIKLCRNSKKKGGVPNPGVLRVLGTFCSFGRVAFFFFFGCKYKGIPKDIGNFICCRAKNNIKWGTVLQCKKCSIYAAESLNDPLFCGAKTEKCAGDFFFLSIFDMISPRHVENPGKITSAYYLPLTISSPPLTTLCAAVVHPLPEI